MARIRTIRPEFWSSEQIADCSPTARLLFIGMWSFSDDGGAHPASLRRLKMEVFPADTFADAEMGAMVDELKKAKLIIEYEAENAIYWQITGWKHQKIEKPNIRYPRPLAKFGEESATGRGLVGEESATGRRGVTPGRACARAPSPPKGDFVQGKQEAKAPPRQTKIPDEWEATDDRMRAAYRVYQTAGIMAMQPEFVRNEAIRFKAHYQGNGLIYENWDAMWTKWITGTLVRNSAELEKMRKRPEPAGAGSSGCTMD